MFFFEDLLPGITIYKVKTSVKQNIESELFHKENIF